MRKIFAIFLAISTALCFSLIGLSSLASSKTDVEIDDFIEAYYASAYQDYLNLTDKNTKSFIDTETLFGKNYLSVLDELTRQNKYAQDIGYADYRPDDIKYSVKTTSTKISEDSATAKVFVDYDTKEAAPWFLLPGTNTFNLTKQNNSWFISSIEYPDDVLFNMLNKDTFYYVDDDSLHARIDKEYSDMPTANEDHVNNLISPQSNPYTNYTYSTS